MKLFSSCEEDQWQLLEQQVLLGFLKLHVLSLELVSWSQPT